MRAILARHFRRCGQYPIVLPLPAFNKYGSSHICLHNNVLLLGGLFNQVRSYASAVPALLNQQLLDDVEKNFWSTPLSQVMSDKPREAYIVKGDVALLEALQQMVTNNIESVHVVASSIPEAPHLGVFNERDFLHLLISQDSVELLHRKLEDFVQKQSHNIVCGLYDSVKDGIYLMEKHKIHLVPLVLRPNQPLENIMNRDCAQILSAIDLRNFLLSHVSLETLRWFELIAVGDILKSMNREARSTDHLVTVDAREVVADACKRMLDNKVGCVVVGTFEGTNPLKPYPNYYSLLTQRDIVVQYLKSGKKALKMPVAELVSSKPLRVSSPNFTTLQVLEMQYEDDCRFSAVFSTDERDSQDLTSTCMALLSTRDILRHCLMMLPSR
ncbi:hypothetical protein GpartN1_g2250.t1 [Galdieria partita]|uniref:CBS domain-containing protein n=1 Tax=Galdieria partita TaxID=83374 RepID=A0A9C7PUH8_9RHOD|nr:hypothetical protein GpartN1_g2250.t1 [Galdieria partita]